MPEPAADHRPNVLLVCTDHWPGPLMRPAGHPTIMTPTLQHLADCGLYYPNAYSATPMCVPARRALMTGLTSQSHGMRRNGGAHAEGQNAGANLSRPGLPGLCRRQAARFPRASTAGLR